MAHQIEDNKAFFVSTPAWHNLGTLLTDAPDVQTAWQLAYPHSIVGAGIEAFIHDANGNRASTVMSDFKAIIRDDGAQLGIVGQGYKLEQPVEVLSFFQPFLDSGLVELEAGGSLNDGKRMWALGKIKQSEIEIIKGDCVKAYLLAATSFDGSLSKVIKFCGTRVVCANTLAVAQREKGGLEFKIRHTKNMADRNDDASKAISGSLEAHRKSVEAYQVLARKHMTQAQMENYIEGVFTDGAKRDDDGEISSQLQTKIDLVTDLLESQRGLELVPAIRGTAWQAYNAVSEYVTHHAGRSEDTRLSNQWFDSATQGLNQRALEAALIA